MNISLITSLALLLLPCKIQQEELRINYLIPTLKPERVTVTTYTPSNTQNLDAQNLDVTVFPNPTADLIAVQLNDLTKLNYEVSLLDIAGKVIHQTTIKQGSTIAYFNTRTLYAGTYFVKISNGVNSITKTVLIAK